jgi:sugar lactone lactonase YvrE
MPRSFPRSSSFSRGTLSLACAAALVACGGSGETGSTSSTTTGDGGGGGGASVALLDEYPLTAQYPEGGTYDPTENAFYVGSLGDGSVHRVDAATGEETVLFSETAPGTWWTLGMDIDVERRRLWVCAMDDRSPDPRAGRVWIFDLGTGMRVADHALSAAAADATCTDVAVTKDGRGYVCDREAGNMYRVDETAGASLFTSSPDLKAEFVGQNALVVLPDESALLSLLYLPSSLARVDLGDGTVKTVTIAGKFEDFGPLHGADGMAYADGAAWVAFTGMLVKLTPTASDWSAAKATVAVIPDGTTDIIRAPGAFYLLNGQAVRFALGSPADPFRLMRFNGNL